jgi:broad specificity phosphatase PhoE
MKVWVLHGIHEGEMFTTTHLTEKGAALAAIADVFEFLGIEDEETATAVMNRKHWAQADPPVEEDPPEWDFEKMKDMKRSELWVIFRDWSEMTWDNDYGYQVEVTKTEIQV